MVDFNKISQKVAAFVDETMKLDGNKKKIDTQRECDKIGEYLNKNRADLGSQEVQYLEGLQVEFTTTEEQRKAQEAQKDFEASMTRGTKEAVDRIAKRMENKKLIDTDEEAQALLLMLRNTKGEYNKFDLEYIRQTLIKAGYESLLPKDEANNVEDKKTDEAENTNANDTENTKEADTCNCNCDCKQDEQVGTGGGTTTEPPKGDDKKGEPTKVDEPLGTDAPPRANRPPKKKARIDDSPKADKPPKSEEPPKDDTTTKKSEPDYKIDERNRTAGAGHAHALIRELDEKIIDNDDVVGILNQINSDNAYSFFKTYNTTTMRNQINHDLFGGKVRWDPFNKITAETSSKAMGQLLAQAKKMKLDNTAAYKQMEQVINTYKGLTKDTSWSDPSVSSQTSADQAIEGLLQEMGKHLK